MTQYARPDGDVSTGSWTDDSAGFENLYQAIDESGTADDTDYIYSIEQESGSPDTATFTLSNVTDPSGSTLHKVTYRAKGDGGEGDVPTLTVVLLDGSTSIASWTNSSVATSFTDYTNTLTATEANNISDYTDLKLRFTRAVGDPMSEIYVSQSFFECPDAGGGGGGGGTVSRSLSGLSAISGIQT